MKINDKLLKPITEVNYLRAENVERYRVIIRFFYQEHESIHYWIYKEEVFAMMKEFSIFQDYTIEQCKSDLAALTAWGNLVALQDTTQINNLTDFYNQNYRYQLSDYTIEIERMTIQLENLEIEGASLEPTLLERIQTQILQLKDMVLEKDEVVSGWWRSLNNDFIRLNQNYQDYLKMLSSVKAEQMMKTTEFLVFKDKLITYLQTFVKGLQEHSFMIEHFLRGVKETELDTIFTKVTAYEVSIPRIDMVVNETDIRSLCEARWSSIFHWFIGEKENNEVNRLYEVTNGIIRKITRYALQIGELYDQGVSRKEEYRQIANMFTKCDTLYDAHCFSAMIFGPESCMHLKDLTLRETESIHSGVYEEKASFIALESRSRKASKKAERKPAIDYTLEKEMNRLQIEKQLEEDHERMKQLCKEGTIDFTKLPKISSHDRKVLLNWLSKALNTADKRSRNEFGEYYKVILASKEECKMQCEDGDFYLPGFQIIFEEEGK